IVKHLALLNSAPDFGIDIPLASGHLRREIGAVARLVGAAELGREHEDLLHEAACQERVELTLGLATPFIYLAPTGREHATNFVEEAHEDLRHFSGWSRL